MKVYFGSKGSKYFILCPEFEECYSFNMFGTLVSKEEGISSCDNWSEVDFISFVSSDTRSCELLYNSEKAVINEPLLNCILSIRKYGKYLGTAFTIEHEDSVGKYTQVIFVLNKGVITKSMLGKRFSINNWNSLF